MAPTNRRLESLRQVRGIEEVCAMPRDHYEYQDWSIMTDGVRVWISKQKIGQNRTDHIEVRTQNGFRQVV